MDSISDTITLNDGTPVPVLGLGVWQLDDDATYASTRAAVEAGYRHIDTAAVYGNEAAVGRAVADAVAAGDVRREDLFITTKLWNADQGLDEGCAAFQASLDRLGLEYVDLYLLHWPCPAYDRYIDAYRALTTLQGLGRVQSIGVCNFYPEVLDDLEQTLGQVPAVNQIELHPGFSQAEQRADNARRGIATEAWSPLGKGAVLDDPVIGEIAREHGVTPAQAVIRWHLQLGNIVIPRSSRPERVRENADVFGFTLPDDEMARITALDREDGRVGPDPREMNAGTPVGDA